MLFLTDLSHAPVNGACFNRGARSSRAGFTALPPLSLLPLRLVARCSWCRGPTRGIVQKLEKPREHAHARTHARHYAIPRIPLSPFIGNCPRAADRVNTRRRPDQETRSDAIAVRERQSHPRRFKNVATFPSPEAIRNPIWQKRDTPDQLRRAGTTLSDSNRTCNVRDTRKSIRKSYRARYETPRARFLSRWIFFGEPCLGITEFSNLLSCECDSIPKSQISEM